MTFLAQFQHDARRLDLGADGRILFIFQCRQGGECETWDANSGANFALVMEGEDLTSKMTRPPETASLELSCEIKGWIEHDDKVPKTLLPSFLKESSYAKIEDQLKSNIVSVSKLGGTPYWIQSPDEAPTPDWVYVGSLDSQLSFYRDPATTSSEVVRDAGIKISEDSNDRIGRKWYTEGPNFGDMGILYIFLKPQGTLVPNCKVFWQCG